MSTTIQPVPAEPPAGRLTPELIGQIARLSPESKEHLLVLLEDELDGGPRVDELAGQPADDPERVKAAWKDELAKRIRDIQDGKVELVDGHDSLSRMRERL